MNSEWQARVKELYLAARGRGPEERSGYLDEACGEDAELRRELESLLVERGSEVPPVSKSPVTSCLYRKGFYESVGPVKICLVLKS